MELTNEFTVALPVDQAWSVLTDLERIAPCMPGAQLQEIEGDEYRGVVKVKVGPITAQYKGKAQFVEKDEAARKCVLKAEGRDTRGQGNASALITTTFTDEGGKTRVEIVTDLTITGRAAQFGRGVLADVSSKLIGQFVTCLETNVIGSEAPAAPPESTTSGGEGKSEPTQAEGPRAPQQASYQAEPVDLLGSSVAIPVLKRLIPSLIGAFLALKIVKKIFRRGGKA